MHPIYSVWVLQTVVWAQERRVRNFYWSLSAWLFCHFLWALSLLLRVSVTFFMIQNLCLVDLAFCEGTWASIIWCKLSSKLSHCCCYCLLVGWSSSCLWSWLTNLPCCSSMPLCRFYLLWYLHLQTLCGGPALLWVSVVLFTISTNVGFVIRKKSRVLSFFVGSTIWVSDWSSTRSMSDWKSFVHEQDCTSVCASQLILQRLKSPVWSLCCLLIPSTVSVKFSRYTS